MAGFRDAALFMDEVACVTHLPRRPCPNTLLEAQPNRKLLSAGLCMQVAIPTILWRSRFPRKKRRALLESAIAAKQLHLIVYRGRFMSSRLIIVTEYGLEMLSHFYDIYAKSNTLLATKPDILEIAV